MRDVLAYPHSKTVRAAIAAARQDQIDRHGFAFASALLAAASILFAASIVLTRLG